MNKYQKSGWERFLNLCQHCQDKQQLNELLRCCLTTEERASIGLRIELIAELLKGEKPQRAIAKELQISIAKITRGSNVLKEIGLKLKKYLQKELL